MKSNKKKLIRHTLCAPTSVQNSDETLDQPTDQTNKLPRMTPLTLFAVCLAVWLFLSWKRNILMDKQVQLKFGNVTQTSDKWILEMDFGFLATTRIYIVNNRVLITGHYLENGLWTTLSVQYRIPAGYSTIATNSFFGKLKVVARYEGDWLFKWIWRKHFVWTFPSTVLKWLFRKFD